MPDDAGREYNPVITGFSAEAGALHIPLTRARKKFGQLPSRYGFVSAKKNGDIERQDKRALNLTVGHMITQLLHRDKRNLKRGVYRFFNTWHRDLAGEFNIHIDPFYNMNDAGTIRCVLKENVAGLAQFSHCDIRAFLAGTGLIRRDVLHSIRPHLLLEKTTDILEKKLRHGSGNQAGPIRDALNRLNCLREVAQLGPFLGKDLLHPGPDALESCGDEIAKGLLALNRFHPLSGAGALTGITGRGIEFEFATRDHTFLELGKVTGDCTADKRNFQADRNVENIFWTVFSWILDRNYQILKVFCDGEFVMKVHLLPLYVTGAGRNEELATVSSQRSEYSILAVDAVETTLAFRGRKFAAARQDLLARRDEIFYAAMDRILQLADAMHIHDVYAEKFSNTPWVRRLFADYSEIFFHVDRLVKIDQLEDVFTLADRLGRQMGYESPKAVFMELQMKNTHLSPGYINKSPGLKSFALIRGTAEDGIPMKHIIGV